MNYFSGCDGDDTLVCHLSTHETQLLERLRLQWIAKSFCDLTLVVQDGTLMMVHSCVLSAFSPTVAEMLTAGQQTTSVEHGNSMMNDKVGRSKHKDQNALGVEEDPPQSFPLNSCAGLRQGNVNVEICLNFSPEVVECILMALYTGMLQVKSSHLQEFIQAVQWLRAHEIFATIMECCKGLISSLSQQHSWDIDLTNKEEMNDIELNECLKNFIKDRDECERISREMATESNSHVEKCVVDNVNKTSIINGLSLKTGKVDEKENIVEENGKETVRVETSQMSTEVDGTVLQSDASSYREDSKLNSPNSCTLSTSIKECTKDCSGTNTPSTTKQSKRKKRQNHQSINVVKLRKKCDRRKIKEDNAGKVIVKQTNCKSKQEEVPSSRFQVKNYVIESNVERDSSDGSGKSGAQTIMLSTDDITLPSQEKEVSQEGVSKEEDSKQRKGQVTADHGRKTRKQRKCCYCKKVFTDLDVYVEHMQAHRPYRCEDCGAAFPAKPALTKHIMSAHLEEKILIMTCTLCVGEGTVPFRTKIEASFRRHALDVHNEKRPFMCTASACSFQTNKRLQLERHVLNIHSNERLYQWCDLCRKEFQGLRVAHERTCMNQMEFLCDLCGMRFNLMQSMKAHRRSVHFGVKKYTCSVCGHTFSYHSNLRRHMRIHDNIFPYECHACGQKFRHSNSLKAHLTSKHKGFSVSDMEEFSGK